MDVDVTMPSLSSISETVKVVRWLVSVGEPVRRGEPLLEVETAQSRELYVQDQTAWSICFCLTEKLLRRGKSFDSPACGLY